MSAAARLTVPKELTSYLQSRPPIASAVLEALRTQNAPLSAAQEKNLALLEAGAPCVVTGQQLGIFLGPLFTLYKISSAIAYADDFGAVLERPVVPIFWLQSEDHDLAEVSTVTLIDNEGAKQTLSLQPESAAANRRSVGSITFGKEIDQLLQTVEGIIGGGQGLELFRRYYQAGQTFSSAFNGVLQDLYSDSGLLTFDSRDPAAHACAAPVFEQALTRHEDLSKLLVSQTAALEASGHPAQVKIRQNSPLFFFHPEGQNADRFRLEQRGPDLVVPETGFSISAEKLQSLVKSSTGSFSTSALLRPLIQDLMLPTLAYVAGPAEQQYWQQIIPLYEQFKRPQPLVVPRTKLLLLESKARRIAEQLGVNNDDLMLDSESLRSRLAAAGLPKSVSPSEVKAQLEQNTVKYLESVLSELIGNDPSLASELTRTKEKVDRSVQAFIDKLQETLDRRGKASGGKAEKLLSFVAPGGIPQERACAFIQFWTKYEGRLLETVVRAIELYEGQMKAVEIA